MGWRDTKHQVNGKTLLLIANHEPVDQLVQEHQEPLMSPMAEQPLSVAIRDLPPIPIAYTYCHLQQEAGDYNDQIRDGFQQVKDWAAQRGYDLSVLRVIGIPHVSEAQLTGYECGIELPETIQLSTEAIQTKQLSGGRYAILSLEKDSATIGETIGRFFAEYVPQHQLVIDSQRPSYEIYYESVMDFCVPIQ